MKILGGALLALVLFSTAACSDDSDSSADRDPSAIVTAEQSENPFAGQPEEWKESLDSNEQRVADSLEALDPALSERAEDLLVVCGWLQKGVNGTALVEKVAKEFKIPTGKTNGKGEPKTEPLSDGEAAEVIRATLQFACPM